MTNADFLLLQLNDATFPIGNYSLSWGLETFVQQGNINNSQTAAKYIEDELENSFIYNELLPVRFAWENADNIEELEKLDSLYESSRSPLELREGSKKLANRFYKTTSAWNCTQNKYVAKYFPIAYGSYCKIQGAKECNTLATYLYSQTSARVTTSVKLVPLSQTDGQLILNNLIVKIPKLIDSVLSFTKEDLFISSPGIDIRAMQHESLYTRLYMS